MMCRSFRWHLSNLEGAEPSKRARAHLRSCTSCQLFKDRLEGLETSLRVSGAAAPPPVPAPARRAWPLWIGGMAAAAAASLLLWTAQVSNEPASRAEPDPAEMATAHDAPESPAEARPSFDLPSISDQALARLEYLSELSPMEEELEAWQKDGRRALQSLRSLGRQSR